MKKLSELFKKTKPIEKTKSIDGQRLTEWEKDFIWKSLHKDGTIICPNCESAHMYEGPSGGMSVNIRCPKCGQGINFLMLHERDMSALDWCDNIGVDTKWTSDKYEEVKPEPEVKVEKKSWVRRQHWMGLPLGWIFGMLIQLFAQLFIKADYINPRWWITQLIGLAIMTAIAAVLDWHFIQPYYIKVRDNVVPWSEKQWNVFVAWLKN